MQSCSKEHVLSCCLTILNLLVVYYNIVQDTFIQSLITVIASTIEFDDKLLRSSLLLESSPDFPAFFPQIEHILSNSSTQIQTLTVQLILRCKCLGNEIFQFPSLCNRFNQQKLFSTESGESSPLTEPSSFCRCIDPKCGVLVTTFCYK